MPRSLVSCRILDVCPPRSETFPVSTSHLVYPNTHDSCFQRPVPKFLCVKGILFFSFWQSIAVSFLVAVGVITRLGPYTDTEHISLGLTDTLICIEMPFFAAAHMYAFSYRDFTNPPASIVGGGRSPIYVARMTLGYALRDAFGLKDLVEDTRTTLRGEGINYRAFEPSEGGMHIGAARDRRIRAGLRYAAGGKRKYWLPELADGHPERDSDLTAPLFAADAEDVVHDAPDMHSWRYGARIPGDDVGVEDEHEYALTFSDALAGPEGVDEVLYDHAKKYLFGDYLYPVVDVSSEEARRAMRDEEERVVRETTSGGFRRDEVTFSGYGATQNGKSQARQYDDERDARTAASTAYHENLGSHYDSRTPQTPSPLRRVSDCPPMTTGSRSSSHSHPPSQAVSRLRLPDLPRILSSSTSASTLSSPSSPRISKRTSRAPLVKADAVDLVVPADSLGVPSTSGGPHSPVLIRVWDEHESGAGGVSPISPVRTAVDEDERRGDWPHSDGAEAEYVEGPAVQEDVAVVRAQTPPAYARVDRYGLGIPEAEEGHNPWA